MIKNGLDAHVLHCFFSRLLLFFPLLGIVGLVSCRLHLFYSPCHNQPTDQSEPRSDIHLIFPRQLEDGGLMADDVADYVAKIAIGHPEA